MKQTTTYKVGTKTRLDAIFTNGIPVNAFIDKGRCAIGATHGEITNKNRSTIITVPNVSILLCKSGEHSELDIVYENVRRKDVEEMLAIPKPGHKIMTTPEGVKKIIEAAIAVGRYEEMITEWFLLLDECHSFISEDYREYILRPFDYFWDFKYKSIISATPYEFSDPRFQALDRYKIVFNRPLGKVMLVDSLSPMAALNWVLKHPDDYPGNVHIFLNSVTAIRNAIQAAGITDCRVFCANDKDNSNMRKLGEFIVFYLPEPANGSYKKYNFYTSKYFEGWDLRDDNATMVFVTDVYQPHTMVGVSNKGKQAMGRLRGDAHKLIHITNHKNLDEYKSLLDIKQDYYADAQFLIKQNNDYAIECREQGWDYQEDERLKKFADKSELTNIATLNLMKLDQQINEAFNNEVYNHVDRIEQAWGDAYFEIEREYTNVKLETTTTMKRKSAATQLKEDYQMLKNLSGTQTTGTVFNMFGSIETEIKKANPIAYNAHKYLDEETMEQLNYNVKKVKAEIIFKENIKNEVKLLKLLAETFIIGQVYSNSFIKDKLQEFYNKLEIKDENGKIKTAVANQLGDKGRFEVKNTKRKSVEGKEEHVKLILRSQFALKMAA